MELQQHLASAGRLGASPWTLRHRFKQLLWEMTWAMVCRWTPKPLNFWRLWILRRFGAKVRGRPFVHQRARIQIPWNIVLGDRACIGDRANLYSLDQIVIGERAIIGQESYLCTGSHDLGHLNLPLITAPIEIAADVFLGARVFVMPGKKIHEGAVIGANSTVTKDIPSWMIAAGNPANIFKERLRVDRMR